MKIVHIDEENLDSIRMTWRIWMKFSEKSVFYNIKPQKSFSPSLENTVLEKP